MFLSGPAWRVIKRSQMFSLQPERNRKFFSAHSRRREEETPFTDYLNNSTNQSHVIIQLRLTLSRLFIIKYHLSSEKEAAASCDSSSRWQDAGFLLAASVLSVKPKMAAVWGGADRVMRCSILC